MADRPHAVAKYMATVSSPPGIYDYLLGGVNEIKDLFAGLELIPAGLVSTREWGTTEPPPAGQARVLAGVGRLPS